MVSEDCDFVCSYCFNLGAFESDAETVLGVPGAVAMEGQRRDAVVSGFVDTDADQGDVSCHLASTFESGK